MAGSSRRERELARAKYERQTANRAARDRARRRRTVISTVAGLAIVLVGVYALTKVVGDSGTTDASTTPTASASSTGSTTPSPSATAKGCKAAVTPTTKTQTWPSAPANTLVKGSTYHVVLTTNCGTIDIQADAAAAPKTTNSQVFLANQKFFDASSCFRLTTEGLFVLQCGSPTNNGQGGPGYTIPDENLPKAGDSNYPVGTVAMANSGANTNGSQFFLVYKDTTLPASYTIWGKVVSGLDVLTNVAALGVDNGGTDGSPLQPLVITKATTKAVG